MKTLIILSAGHFLNSYSGYQAFLNRIEMSELTGVNYEELRIILNNTISGIESARAAYDALKNLAENTEYNQGFISSLVSFNYPGFCEINGLNTVIFSMVAKLLVRSSILACPRFCVSPILCDAGGKLRKVSANNSVSQ